MTDVLVEEFVIILVRVDNFYRHRRLIPLSLNLIRIDFKGLRLQRVHQLVVNLVLCIYAPLWAGTYVTLQAESCLTRVVERRNRAAG